MTNTTQALFINTPEDYFIPNNADKKELPVDAIICAMGRASSVIDLIRDNGHTTGDGFTISHTSIMNALGCLSGLIEQAETMIKKAFVE